MSSLMVLNTSASRSGPRPPHLKPTSAPQISPKYIFQDLEKYSERDMMPSDASSLSSFETYSSCSSPSLDGSSESLTIVLQSQEDSGDDDISHGHRKDRRPLPPVPQSPVPTSPVLSSPPRSDTSPRTRPLPPTPYLKTSDFSISVTLATPEISPSPPLESPSPCYLFPPKVRRLPKPDSSLSLHTATLSPPSDQCSSEPHSPASSIRVPTPDTARRRRLSKLKRFLGETVPDELVPIISSARDPQTAKDLLAHLSNFKGTESAESLAPALDPTVIARRLKELEDDKSLSDSEEKGEVILDMETSSCIQSATPFRAVPSKKYSKKWVWEKGGRRREEQDYDYIMRALRTL
ncbi:hypothetical protein BDP27DRAFT_1309844 [Rhodocollybia butyracea]|uniref:Uncharacterized protein n=1 Tax=Rhodocollybia butyracea TaxID=206335 RepID=A0A9P5QAR4_9AGAR|nr:hypothetical protein BDP27DRAFT_1309844 [Rhodocollybia butyracea]